MDRKDESPLDYIVDPAPSEARDEDETTETGEVDADEALPPAPTPATEKDGAEKPPLADFKIEPPPIV